jgi:hypothetical protein
MNNTSIRFSDLLCCVGYICVDLGSSVALGICFFTTVLLSLSVVCASVVHFAFLSLCPAAPPAKQIADNRERAVRRKYDDQDEDYQYDDMLGGAVGERLIVDFEFETEHVFHVVSKQDHYEPTFQNSMPC